VRIDQFISQSSQYSRKDVKQLIREKRIHINGQLCNNAGTHVNESHRVTIDNTTVEWPKELYFILNKPQGYCCSHEDDGAISAIKLLPVTNKKLHFAGRLDADTTGLVLLSSDGQWCHRVTSPKQRIEKRKNKHYRVSLEKPLSSDDIRQLEQGILLRNETEPTLPAMVSHLHDTVYNIVICEGRYHQVKRMFAAVGNHVCALHRFKIADIELESTLETGNFRELTTTEIDQFNYDH
jgi:16S rRNA pseudouridine516 synthase